ncbi:hypothetical protein AQ616_18785 [Oceanobacillus sp. E9]|uniref:dUTP diphosphatase n=1 Tax=Oceanobacillus sp. E9 TaxID=1742575 RepID=UPI00084E83AD|nr:dUTP diphosphatase [Oceanobacillus sp. E9]OEH52952.1 hypothetical protein AQ616_18785 [Oceanobacillus sp. E9]
MNLDKLMTIQDDLDKHIEVKKGLQGQDLLDKKILALQVELGELANEWRGFKFWSSNQEPRGYNLYTEGKGVEQKNPLLEEYVDCLHFILSIGLELDRKDDLLPQPYVNRPNASTDEIIGQFGQVFKNTWHVPGDYYHLINNFVELGSMLGFTTEQIEQAYLDKNKVNHARQESGY